MEVLLLKVVEAVVRDVGAGESNHRGEAMSWLTSVGEKVPAEEIKSPTEEEWR
jgi:hypothetical protein